MRLKGRSVWAPVMVVTLVTALILGAAGCSRGKVPQQQTRSGLTILLATEPDTLDPHQSQSRYASIVFNTMFEPLLWKDEKLAYRPGLATSWEVTPDGKVWTFRLRQGVKFHDGTPFDANAVKFNFDRMVDPNIKSVGAGVLIGPYEKTEVVDKYTVKVYFKEPYGCFLDVVSDPYGFLSMVSPTAAQKYGKDFNMHPCGTGPFVFKEYRVKESVTVVKNPDYNWGPEFFPYTGPAHVDQITFRFIPEAATRLTAFENGEAEVIMEIPPQEVSRIRSDNRFRVVKAQVPGVPVVAIVNAKREPTNDLRVRQALNYAVNQDELVEVMFNKEITPARSILASNTWGFDPQAASMYQYDPDKAAQLLDQAGWKMGKDGIRYKNGQPLKLQYLALFPPPYDPGEALQAQYKRVGIDLEVRVISGADHRAQCRLGNHHLAWTRWVGLDPRVLDVYFNSANIGTGFNYTHVPDPRMDELLKQALGSEVDPEKRRAVFAEIQRRIMENALCVPLHDTVMIAGTHSFVEGFELGPGGFFPWKYNCWKVAGK